MKSISIIGNIGRDAVINDVNGRKAINFNVAVNDNYKDEKGNKVEKTTWFSVSYWKGKEQSTKIAEYLKKGIKVFIEGTPEPKVYTNKDQNTVPYIQISVRNLELLSSLEPSGKTESKPEGAKTGEADDDLPF